jgi:hypothetical protein
MATQKNLRHLNDRELALTAGLAIKTMRFQLKRRDDAHITSAEKASSVPGIVVDLHHPLLAGLPAHFESSHPSHAVRSPPAIAG